MLRRRTWRSRLVSDWTPGRGFDRVLPKGEALAISPETRSKLFSRAQAQCECTMNTCTHHRGGTRCPHGLSPGRWEAHRKLADGPDTLGNLLAMCAICHKNTRTFGRN